MKNQRVAVLLTCHNRKAKTLDCLASFYRAVFPSEYTFDIFLTDDGSTDGTGEALKKLYPQITLIQGSGNLFWAGGMRMAWESAMRECSYDAFLLLNDDVMLNSDFLLNLMKTEEHSLQKRGKKGIYSGATVDETTGIVSYGGSKIKANHIVMKSQLLSPREFPQECEITNANILWISKNVVDAVGIFDDKYIHGIADYDYSLRAYKKNIPVYLAPSVCGTCTNDHGKNWKKGDVSLKERVAYLKSHKGLAYREYMYYLKRHFPLFVPYSFFMLWMKTFFPFFWDRFKKTEVMANNYPIEKKKNYA